MTDRPDAGDPGKTTEEPVLLVMWRGNRVRVFADGILGPVQRGTTQQHHQAMGDLAHVIGEAVSPADIVARLQASRFGETHRVDLRLQGRALEVWLRQKASAGTDA